MRAMVAPISACVSVEVWSKRAMVAPGVSVLDILYLFSFCSYVCVTCGQWWHQYLRALVWIGASNGGTSIYLR